MAFPINLKTTSFLTLVVRFVTVYLALFNNLAAASPTAVRRSQASSYSDDYSQEDIQVQVNERTLTSRTTDQTNQQPLDPNEDVQPPNSEAPAEDYEESDVPDLMLSKKFRDYNTACRSEWFRFNTTNVKNSQTNKWYADMAKNVLPGFRRESAKPGEDEIDVIGRHLWATPNVGCCLIEGSCSVQWPSCHHIARYGLDFTEGTEVKGKHLAELRRRYFLSMMIMSHHSYIRSIKDGVDSAQAFMGTRYELLSNMFTSDVKGKTLYKCAMRKAIKSAVINTGILIATSMATHSQRCNNFAQSTADLWLILAAVTLGTGGLGVAIGPIAGTIGQTVGGVATKALTSMNRVPLVAAAVRNTGNVAQKVGDGVVKNAGDVVKNAGDVMKNSAPGLMKGISDQHKSMWKDGQNINFLINVGNAWSRDLGWSFSPAIPSNQSRLPEWNELDTLASSCHSIDDFQDAEKANAQTLSTLVNEVFDELLIKNAAKADEFGKSNMIVDERDNLTVVGRELHSFNWAIAKDHENTLVNEMRQNFTDAITKTLVSEMLRASHCYISCSPAADGQQAQHHCSEAARKGDQKANDSLHALATFCPNRELCGLAHDNITEPDCPQAENLVHKNLVCRFACLNVERGQHSFEKGDAIEPEWPEYLKKMGDMQQFPMDPHKIFTEAVLNHQFQNTLNSSGDENGTVMVNYADPALMDRTFQLPVCISTSAFGLSSPPEKGMWPDKSFQPSCGDWRANETEVFLNTLLVGHTTDIFRKRELTQFYRKELRNLDKLASPITAFLTYCEAHVPWPTGGHWDYQKLNFLSLLENPEHFSPNTTAANFHCDRVKREIMDMDELTANRHYCCGKWTKGELEWEDSWLHDRLFAKRIRTAGSLGHCKDYLISKGVAWKGEEKCLKDGIKLGELYHWFW